MIKKIISFQGAKFVEWERADQVMQDIQKLYPMANGTKIMLGVVWPGKPKISVLRFRLAQTLATF